MSKEIKLKLKEAKEFINKKEFEKAIQCCKDVIQEDRNNYTAFVFVGACAQELHKPEQAIKAFKQAAKICPEQLLAWQGLANFYEKVDSDKYCDDLIAVYKKLMKFYKGDNVKFAETLNRLGNLANSHGKAEECFDAMLEYAIQNDGEDVNSQIHIKLEELLRRIGIKNMTEAMKNQYVETFHHLQDDTLLTDDQVKLYLQIVKTSSLKLFCNSCLEFGTKVGQDNLRGTYPLDSYIKVFLEVKLDVVSDPVGCVKMDMVEIIANKLSNICDCSPYLEMLGAWYSWWEDKDVVNSIAHLNKALELIPNAGLTWLMLSTVHLQSGNYTAAKKSAASGLKALTTMGIAVEGRLGVRLKYNLLESCLLMEDSKNFHVALKMVPPTDPKVLFLRAMMAKTDGNLSDLSEVVSLMKVNECESEHLVVAEAWGNILQGEQKKALDMLRCAVDSHNNTSLILIQLGKLLYQMNEPDEARRIFNECSSRYPDEYESYIFLGNICYYQEENYVEAKEVYLKAFQLCPYSPVTGKSLSNVYTKLDMKEENLKLLEYTVASKQCCDLSWAWSRLGLMYLHDGRDTQAISLIQSALSLKPNDRTLWESLGDAYIARGSYVSALKTFEKVLTICSEPSPYTLHSIATIKQKLGMYFDSVQDFRDLLSNFPGFIPGLKGLGETLVLYSKQHLTQMFDGCAFDCCQEAIITLARLVEIKPDLICAWKLLADGCFLVRSLPKEIVKLKIPANLNGGAEEVMEKEKVLRLGTRCYFQAAQMLSTSGPAFYDLGIAFYYLSVEREEQEHASKQDEEMALKMMKKALDLEPNNDRFWNGLGIVACSKRIKNNGLAQHAFIKSVEINGTNAVAWANLGALYLHAKDLKLAHEAFKMAQNADPEYPQGWIGQALVADELSADEAMDLYRHCCSLSRHPISLMGYSQWVCSTLLDPKAMRAPYTKYAIEALHATTVSFDCMLHYNARWKGQPCSLNLLGFLAEREGLLETAEKSYSEALTLVEEGGLVEVWGEEEKLSLVTRKNVARVLCTRKKYSAAIDVLLKVKNPDFEVNATLALSYFFNEQYQEAYSYYESALQWLNSDEHDKSQVLVAMAVIAHKFQGAEVAKTLLFQSCQLRPPSVEGILALGAIGLLTSDATLFSAAIQELDRYRWNIDYIAHYTFLQACCEILKDAPQKATKVFSKALHVRPDCPELWRYYFFVLWLTKSDPLTAARCLLSAWKGMKHDSDLLSIVPICQLMANDHKSALLAAKKAVHMYPESSACWASLVAVMFPHQPITTGAWIIKLIHWLRRRSNTSKAISQWLACYDRRADKILQGKS